MKSAYPAKRVFLGWGFVGALIVISFPFLLALAFSFVTSVPIAVVGILVHRGKSASARDGRGHSFSVLLEPDSVHVPVGGGHEF